MPLDYQHPEKYIGAYHSCYIGYSNDESIRSDAASGGIVSSILVYLLEKGEISGALVSKQEMVEGEISYKTFIATTKEQILDCRTSIYMDFPVAKHYKDILNFDGKVAVISLPCQLQALSKIESQYPQLKEKIVMKIALFCSGSPSKELIEKILKKNKIDASQVERIFFRKGHWRGMTHVKMKDGTEKTFSYLYNICSYKNLYFYSLPRCYSCQDHFGRHSDISCGDVWLKEMKNEPIKHTGIVLRNEKSNTILERMIKDNIIKVKAISGEKVVKSQKRALIYKFNAAMARKKVGKLFGLHCDATHLEKSKWNHYVASFFIALNIHWSKNKRLNKLIFAIPERLMFLYMGFIRALISF